MNTTSYALKLISDLITESERDNILFGYIIGLCEYDQNDCPFNKKNEQIISDSLALSEYLIEFHDFEACRVRIENSTAYFDKFVEFDDFKRYIESAFLKFGIKSSKLMFDVCLSRKSTGNFIAINVPERIESIFEACQKK